MYGGDGAGVTGGIKRRPAGGLWLHAPDPRAGGQGQYYAEQRRGWPVGVFVNVGKAGSDIAGLAEALGRLISLHLRIASPLSPAERAREIIDLQLRGIGGSRAGLGFGPEQIRSLPDAVARAIEAHFNLGMDAAAGASQTASQSHVTNGHSTNGIHGGAGANETNGAGGNRDPAINPLNMEHFAVTGNLCPSCGNNTMHYEEGCRKCVSCGHSEC